MSAKGIFITGTDTGVGKTVVAAVIARLLRQRGIDVGVIKPVTSGCGEVDGRLVSEDAQLLCWAAGTDANDRDATPYLLREPLAPSMAAERDGIRIDFHTIKAAYDRLAARHDFVIVEGAGGLMVPLAGGLLIADLAAHLSLPLLVVARPNLGTINHTLLTTFAARQMGLTVKGVVINNYPVQPGPAEEYAPHLLGSLCGTAVLGVFPAREATDQQQLVAELAEVVGNHILTTFLLKEIGIA
ncbi:dethiobiotin synthase [Geomobilimonas luticola]|uniref:ATP-dependent dethiobiotin synthetase BioD n=1 Tax=Geomobilimonas luticola TaxID=1114878 RepID=A0ABS5SIN2_9BACT|nr:dethiobiotin synthase [Geomobilimonas luticola]MBT0654087.1 dethiobiotin synthase [Geomobilimonas luticola]